MQDQGKRSHLHNSEFHDNDVEVINPQVSRVKYKEKSLHICVIGKLNYTSCNNKQRSNGQEGEKKIMTNNEPASRDVWLMWCLLLRKHILIFQFI